MKIVDLRPDEQYDSREQCSVSTYDMTSPISQFHHHYRLEKAKRGGKDPGRCQKISKFLIDGKHYCAGHAGMIALDHLLQYKPRITREQLQEFSDRMIENVERTLR